MVGQVLDIWQQCSGGGREEKNGEEELQSVCVSYGYNIQLSELQISHLTLALRIRSFLGRNHTLWENNRKLIFPAQATLYSKVKALFIEK